MMFIEPAFWIALLQIIGVNIVLSGDNAVVIALAARSLPARHQRLAVLWGSAGAIFLRVVLTLVAIEVLRWPYLKLIGAALLLWIAVQLLLPGDEDGDEVTASDNLWGAVRTILIADLVMSVDNVLGVAAAAKGSVLLLTLGLGISIPIVIFGSTMLLKVMTRFPIIITIGAALLGWVAGEMGVTDPALRDWVDANATWLHWIAPAGGAIAVVAAGKWFVTRVSKRKPVDLA